VTAENLFHDLEGFGKISEILAKLGKRELLIFNQSQFASFLNIV